MDNTTINAKKDNSKVPIAILSCFLIAFIVQGVLKISGIFIFEKALDWEIFNIIDSNKILQIIYYALIMSLNSYCLSVAFTKSFATNRWYHSLMIVIPSFILTAIRLNITLTYNLQILFDLIIYLIIPLIVKFTSKRDYLIANYNYNNVIFATTLQIGLYFCYLGLTYWSGLLSSFIAINPIFINSSCQFLIRLETYLGLITFTLASNIYVKNKKGGV